MATREIVYYDCDTCGKEDVVTHAFRRVQRFSSDWHANAFAGSTVRKITRGMWALDALNDIGLRIDVRRPLVLRFQDHEAVRDVWRHRVGRHFWSATS